MHIWSEPSPTAAAPAPQAYHELFTDEEDNAFANALFERLDIQHDDKIDYVSFVDHIKLADIPAITSHCRNDGPLKNVRAPLVPELPRRVAHAYLFGVTVQRLRAAACLRVSWVCRS